MFAPFSHIFRSFQGFSGADLRAVVSEAVLACVARTHPDILRGDDEKKQEEKREEKGEGKEEEKGGRQEEREMREGASGQKVPLDLDRLEVCEDTLCLLLMISH